MDKLPSLNALLRTLQQVPYLASRNLYRVVEHFLKMDQHAAELFCAAILRAKEQVVRCEICFCWQEQADRCLFCSDSKRKKDLICVVEGWLDVVVFEKTKAFDGVYHVLDGVIPPLDGVAPDDLTIAQLVVRVTQNPNVEIVLATSQTPEGEATTAYVVNQLRKLGVREITCLSRGIPVGLSLTDVDRLTVHKALKERRPY